MDKKKRIKHILYGIGVLMAVVGFVLFMLGVIKNFFPFVKVGLFIGVVGTVVAGLFFPPLGGGSFLD